MDKVDEFVNIEYIVQALINPLRVNRRKAEREMFKDGGKISKQDNHITLWREGLWPAHKKYIVQRGEGGWKERMIKVKDWANRPQW